MLQKSTPQVKVGQGAGGEDILHLPWQGASGARGACTLNAAGVPGKLICNLKSHPFDCVHECVPQCPHGDHRTLLRSPSRLVGPKTELWFPGLVASAFTHGTARISDQSGDGEAVPTETLCIHKLSGWLRLREIKALPHWTPAGQ